MHVPACSCNDISFEPQERHWLPLFRNSTTWALLKAATPTAQGPVESPLLQEIASLGEQQLPCYRHVQGPVQRFFISTSTCTLEVLLSMNNHLHLAKLLDGRGWGLVQVDHWITNLEEFLKIGIGHDVSWY